MKLSRILSILFFLFSVVIFSPPTLSYAIDPFPPFSKDGNPPEDYYYDKLFPLFRFIKPAQLKVYENRDRSRNYEPLEICRPKEANDSRDKYCDNSGSYEGKCTGGNVNICYQNSGTHAYTAHSDSGNCNYDIPKKEWIDGEIVKGKCEYTQTPSVSGELKATDYSAIDRLYGNPKPIPSSDPESIPRQAPEGSYGSLVYRKLQGENFRFDGTGTDNSITWGTHRLQLTADEQIIKQLLVLWRAKQTRETINTTGEWPLGWVDWGYVTSNGKNLLTIANEVPGEATSSIKKIAESVDDYFLNAGNLTAVSDTSQDRVALLKLVAEAREENPQPEWLTDVLQSPIYSPSFRQGYSRASICVWDKCCPGPKCPYPDSLLGNSLGLYGDISISQTFGASLDDLLLNYSLEEGGKVFRKLAQANPLIRFAGSASANAIPSRINSRLTAEIKDKCFQYVPDFDNFTIKKFGFIMDYSDPPTYLDPKKECPGWAIQPELKQEKGGAFPQSLFAKIISLIWGGKSVDQVDPVKEHLITIPDAMGQFISEIQEPVFETRDSIVDNEASKVHNDSITNIIDSTNEYLTAGKGQPVGDSQRRLGLLTCADPDYSSPLESNIEAYALGTRVGCFTLGTPTEASCDASSATKIVEITTRVGKKYGLPPKTLEAMFKYEGYVGKMGEGCKEEAQYNVMGPFQISHSAYEAVTCDSERYSSPQQESSSCGESGKLSRCSLEDSVEMAARVLLQKLNAYGYYEGTYDCSAHTVTNLSSLALYRAVNAYSGCGVVGGKSYANYICEYAGNCPSPIPNPASPVSCAGN